jgi:hypothetical protein
MKHTNLIPVTGPRLGAPYLPDSDRPLGSRRCRLGLGALFLLVPTLVASAQNYSLDWHTIAGGGGASAGGAYSVEGTIGEPDAGSPLTGGNYSITGGFWSLVAAVQTPGAPILSVALTNGMVRISWPQPAPDWVLEQTSTLTGAGPRWMEIAPPYPTNSTHFHLTVPPANGHSFYRLKKP